MAHPGNATSDPPLFWRVMAQVDRVIGWVENATVAIGCIALFVTMMLIFVDAACRYLFNSPLKVTTDLVNLYLLSTMLLLLLSFTFRRGGHITVDLFAQRMPKRLYYGLIGATLLCADVVVSTMVHELLLFTRESWLNGETTIGIFAWPVWPSKAIVTAGLAVLAIRMLHAGISSLVASLTGNTTFAPSIAHGENEPVEEGV